MLLVQIRKAKLNLLKQTPFAQLQILTEDDVNQIVSVDSLIHIVKRMMYLETTVEEDILIFRCICYLQPELSDSEIEKLANIYVKNHNIIESDEDWNTNSIIEDKPPYNMYGLPKRIKEGYIIKSKFEDNYLTSKGEVSENIFDAIMEDTIEYDKDDYFVKVVKIMY